MALGGDGPKILVITWTLMGITFVFVGLRIYTRLVVVRSYGVDDHVYVIASLLLLGFTTMVTLAAVNGFGQAAVDVKDNADITRAALYGVLCQLFGIAGSVLSKVSLGLFLIRVVNEKWHVRTLKGVMVILTCISIVQLLCFFLQCTPPSYLWDRSIHGGYCSLNMRPSFILWAVASTFTDFFFAAFPWTVIWALKMHRREKIVICASLSLGVIAGAFGIKRAMEIRNVVKPAFDPLKDPQGMILWSSAEQCVTMVCIGIPVCRPLYKQYLERFFSSANSRPNGYHKESSADNFNGFPLRTLCDSAARPDGQRGADVDLFSSQSKHEEGNRVGVLNAQNAHNTRHSFVSPLSRAYATAIGRSCDRDLSSDEEVLANDFRGNNSEASRPDKETGIRVTEEFRVTRDDKE